jgi:hypothetical protein
MPVASLVLLAAASVGLVALAVQLVHVLRHHREPSPPCSRVGARPGISILKPLCGVDDDLEANLEQFAALGYPSYEVILGVKDMKDPAYAMARKAVARWPDVMRLVLQEGEPGLNPKVNQLITLASEARHDLWVISGSNVRVAPGYLDEIADGFADPKDVLLFVAWCNGLFSRTVDWRGNRLRVLPGTRLASVQAQAQAPLELPVLERFQAEDALGFTAMSPRAPTAFAHEPSACFSTGLWMEHAHPEAGTSLGSPLGLEPQQRRRGPSAGAHPALRARRPCGGDGRPHAPGSERGVPPLPGDLRAAARQRSTHLRSRQPRSPRG